MKSTRLLVLALLCFFQANAQFKPDAGLITPYTQTALLTVSSGNNAGFIIDGNSNTFWESANPLPNNYISNRKQNLFLDDTNYEIVGINNNYLLAFDGNTDTKAEIKNRETKIRLYTNKPIKFLSLKFNITDTLILRFRFSDGAITEKKYSPTSSYSLQTLELDRDKVMVEITLVNSTEYQLFELAAINSDLTEWAVFDFGSPKQIGYISSKHLNDESITSIEVLYSNNGINWASLLSLNPNAVAAIPLVVSPPVYAQYLKVRFYITPKPYKKATLREFAVYDVYGPFGKPPRAYPANSPWGKSFGVNTIWGWGYGVPSSMLKKGAGADKFSRAANQARSYHRLDWDIEKPGDNPGFIARSQMRDSLWSKWLNWEEEYSLWQESGFSTDACILFNSDYFPEDNWVDPYPQSKKYGQEFGKFFGKQNKLIEIVEVGNEPWEYPKPLYREILKGMADGIRTTVPDIKVLACGLQAYNKHSGLDNYITGFLDGSVKTDGLNTHIYSYTFDESGSRIAINPEDPRSETWSVNNLVKWAEANNYPQDIYVTEFGYDSYGGNEDCTHSNCISELEQAIYGIRQAMIFYRLGVKKFYWYFYANVDWESILHNRSGLTSSYKNGFQEKLSFKAFEFVQNNLGNLYFSGIIVENEELYCYSFSDKSGNPMALVAWRPTAKDHQKPIWVEIPASFNVKSVSPVVGHDKIISYKREVNSLKIALTGIPVVVLLR